MISDNERVRICRFLILIFLLAEPDNWFFINLIGLDIRKIQALRRELNEFHRNIISPANMLVPYII